MSRSDEKRLDDIRDACTKTAELVRRGTEAFDEEPFLWLALERLVEVACEAASRLDSSTYEGFPGVDWRAMAGVRVLLAHAYHRVERDALWEIVTVDLPRVAEVLGPVDQDATD